MVREVRTVQGDGVVAKLFAKHMKANEQAEFLKSKKVSIAVGTPARVGRLLADGELLPSFPWLLAAGKGTRVADQQARCRSTRIRFCCSTLATKMRVRMNFADRLPSFKRAGYTF